MCSPKGTIVVLATSFALQSTPCTFTKADTTKGFLSNPLSFSSAFDDLVRSKVWKNEAGLLCCCECDFSSQFLTNVKNHIEAKHLQSECQGYNCANCGKLFKTKNSFQTHKSRFKGRCASLNQTNFWIWRFWGASGLKSVEGWVGWLLALLRLFILHPVPDQPKRPHWDTPCHLCWISLSYLFQILPH